MPCIRCNKRCGTGQGIAYCVCGCCNHCHFRWICPDSKHWWRRFNIHKSKYKQPRKKVILGESHGGHDCPRKYDK